MPDRILSEIFEADIDRCTRTYGVSPCTAGVEDSGTARDVYSIGLDGLSQRVTYPGAVPLSASQVTVICRIKQSTFADWTHYVNNNWVGNGWLLYSSATSFIFGVGQSASQVSSAGFSRAGYEGKVVHLCGSYDGDRAKLHIDGAFKSQGASSPGATLTTGATLDSGSGGATDAFEIEGVWMYNRALSDAEIEQHYLGNYPLNGLVGFWPMDEGTGTSAADCSGNGNDATLVSGATWVADLDPKQKLRLASTASASNEAYTGQVARLDDGRERTIIRYASATRTATVSPRWPINLVTRSDEFDNAAWGKVLGVTVTPNAAVAPDGTMTADKVTFPQVTSGERIEQTPSYPAVDAESWSGVVYMKGSGTINVNIGTTTGVGGQTEPTINLTDKWQRVHVTVTYSSPTGNTRFMPAIWRSGNTASEVYLWRGRLMRGSEPGNGEEDIQTVAAVIDNPASSNSYSIIDRPNACYNTFATCQDKANYDAGVHTIKFTRRGAPIPAGQLVRPLVDDIDIAPTEINIEEGYADRSTTRISLADETDSDIDEDPYQANRATPAQGTFWTRLLARSPNYVNRPARLVRAFVDGGVWGSSRTERYIIERIGGPFEDGGVTVTLKDPTKRADRTQLPVPIDGKLVADLPAYSNTGTAQGGSSTTIILADDASAEDDAYNGQEVYLTANAGAGQRRTITDYTGATRTATVAAWAVVPTDITQYEVAPLELDVGSVFIGKYTNPATSGRREFVVIGDEIIEYTAISGSKLTWPDNTYRGSATSLFPSEREDHDIDDTVQQCWSRIDTPVTDVIQAIYTDSGIAAGDIDSAGFAAIETEWYGADYRVTCCLVEPTDADDLLAKLLPMVSAVTWWDPVAQKIKLAALLPGAAAAASWNDTEHLVDARVRAERLDDLRRTRFVVNFQPRLYTDIDDKVTSFVSAEGSVDADAESSDEYGDVRPELKFSQWFRAANRVAMRAWAGRQLTWYRDAPVRMTVALDPKDAPVTIGAQITLTSRYLTDVAGAPKATRMLVTRVKDRGGQLEVRLRSTPFEKRWAFIAPNGTADYPTDTTYAHVSDAAGLMSDGSGGYLII